MKHFFLSFFLLMVSNALFSQQTFNDTMIYKSERVKVGEVLDLDEDFVRFRYVNHFRDTVDFTIALRLLNDLKVYDPDNVLVYALQKHNLIRSKKLQERFPDSVAVSKHMLSVNLFLLSGISPSIKYQYNFGKKMNFAFITRNTYIAPPYQGTFDKRGDLRLSAGIKITPFYNEKYSFGFDFTPMVGMSTEGLPNRHYLFPINLDLDLFFNSPFALSLDAGFGSSYNNGNTGMFVRGHIGLMFLFPQKVKFATEYFVNQ